MKALTEGLYVYNEVFWKKSNLYQLVISDFIATTVSAGHLYIFMLNDELTKNHKDDTESADEQINVFQMLKRKMKIINGHVSIK